MNHNKEYIINGKYFQDLAQFGMRFPSGDYLVKYLYSKYCDPKAKTVKGGECALDSGMVVYDSRFDRFYNHQNRQNL